MYTRSDDDILPAGRRRGGRRARRPPRRPPPAPPAARSDRPPAPPVRGGAPQAAAHRPDAPAYPDAAAHRPDAPAYPDAAAHRPDEAAVLAPFSAMLPAAAAPARPRVGRIVGEVLLTLTAVLGLAMTTLTVVAARTGMRPLVVRSGSMEPTIPTGSMVLVQRVAATAIHVGDVVAVERPDHTRVTHRVVAVERHGATAELTLKGDANEDPDPAPVTVRSADRLVRSVPAVGRVAAWLATAQGGFAVGCVVTAAAMLTLRRRRPRHG